MQVKNSRGNKNGGDPSAPVLHSNLTLIEVADPALMEELKVNRRLGHLILTRLSDRVAVIKPGQADLLLKELLKAGHTPKVINS